MSNVSKYLVRANVALTSNYKLVVDKKYNLYLESYDSNEILSDKKYKGFNISHENFLSERLSKFYENVPIDKSFEVRNLISTDQVQLEYKNQYDDIYYSGAKNVEYNKYIEEFQYNTTLKIEPKKLPKYFFIFRNEGSGYGDYDIKTDLKTDIINSKLIHVTNMLPNDNLGKFFKKNYIDDDFIPDSPFTLNLNLYEFSKWHGYNYYSGGTIEKSLFIDDHFNVQDNDFDFEKFITDGFKNNGVICANYLNLVHLFDDTNANTFIPKNDVSDYYSIEEYPFLFDMINKGDLNESDFIFINDSGKLKFNPLKVISYRNRWSINRYSGYYIDDLKEILKISPYVSTEVIDDDPDIIIENNIFKKNGNFISPLKNEYNPESPVYLKIKDTFYLIEKTTNNDIEQYHIVSDEIINDNLYSIIKLSSDPIKISYEYDSTLGYKNFIKTINDDFYINNIIKLYNNNSSQIFIIKIFDKFYKLNVRHDKIYINTDEVLECNNVQFKSILINDINIETTRVPSKDMDIPYFEIYIPVFTEIGDFDFTHLHTKHANYEYETTILANTDLSTITYFEPYEYTVKRPMFFKYDLVTPTPIKNLKIQTNYKYSIKDNSNEYKLFENPYILPESSEYAANGDLYTINNLNLTDIWNVNQYVNKFGYSGSNDVNSLMYKLNNSFEYWGINNKGFDIHEKQISIFAHNLDWFYTFGTPVKRHIDSVIENSTIYNSNYKKYMYEYYRTLNIDLEQLITPFSSNIIIRNNKINFNYNNYINNTRFDVLSYFLDQDMNLHQYDDIYHIKDVNRFAILNNSGYTDNANFFYKGLNGYINYCELNDYNDPESSKTYYSAPDLENYKMSAIFIGKETEDTTLHGKAGLEFIINKYHKHILICAFIYVPYGSVTELDYTYRDLYYSDDRYIRYSVDDGLGGSIYTNSELKIHDMILFNIYDIMLNNKMTAPGFSNIAYKIVGPNKEYTITNVETTAITSVLTLNEEHNYIESNKIVINSVIYTIKSKIDNYKISIENFTGSVNDTVKYAQSVKPFEFVLYNYNETCVNTNVNKLSTDNAKILLNNDINLITNDIKVELTDNYLYPVLNNDNSIIYKNKFIENINTNTNLDIIKRYSGNYEPIINNIELFNKTKLKLFHSELYTISAEIINNKKVISVVKRISITDSVNMNTYSSLYKDLNKNIYKNFLLNLGELYTPDLHNVYVTPYNIELKLDTNYFYITFYIDTEQLDIPSTPSYNNKIINIYYVMDKNIYFNFELKDFSLIKEQIIPKVDIDMKNTKDIRLLYPYLDEHGMTTMDRSIFKSNWDNTFFYAKEKNKYNTI